MSSDDEFDSDAYKAYEDQLYGEHSSSGLVLLITLQLPWVMKTSFLLLTISVQYQAERYQLEDV